MDIFLAIPQHSSHSVSDLTTSDAGMPRRLLQEQTNIEGHDEYQEKILPGAHARLQLRLSLTSNQDGEPQSHSALTNSGKKNAKSWRWFGSNNDEDKRDPNALTPSRKSLSFVKNNVESPPRNLESVSISREEAWHKNEEDDERMEQIQSQQSENLLQTDEIRLNSAPNSDIYQTEQNRTMWKQELEYDEDADYGDEYNIWGETHMKQENTKQCCVSDDQHSRDDLVSEMMNLKLELAQLKAEMDENHLVSLRITEERNVLEAYTKELEKKQDSLSFENARLLNENEELKGAKNALEEITRERDELKNDINSYKFEIDKFAVNAHETQNKMGQMKESMIKLTMERDIIRFVSFNNSHELSHTQENSKEIENSIADIIQRAHEASIEKEELLKKFEISGRERDQVRAVLMEVSAERDELRLLLENISIGKEQMKINCDLGEQHKHSTSSKPSHFCQGIKPG
mmetsp:Transcript_49244/g.73274  ORF Transcript_49244/g.73274 Transcript_49244/m.73274 type:complete len:460 (-) Transcript_49244:212-1591(-)|eukprot:CAMPEP_0195523906 /NCGR_PEP_ID=MMETSP0794_2-20130614/23406_1 /TAXON_ID=515487 /ORGANISM="Stephanopyxis turris, Strain CCMP 815" /LENGTH=459 /DNA_ID=CAMNT_0040654009 /DNA_START=191 /DNA_END=1570 /DNA_ORIENTATION=+